MQAKNKIQKIAAIAALVVLSGCGFKQITAFTPEDNQRATEACKELAGKKKPAVPYAACIQSELMDSLASRGSTTTPQDQYILAYRANLARQIDDKQITREQANLMDKQEQMRLMQEVDNYNQAKSANIGNAISQYGYRQQQYYQGLNQQNRTVNCTSQNFSGIVHTNCY